MLCAYTILPEAIEITAIRAQGAGGQNVNKVSSAVHLRFNIHAAGLPEMMVERLLQSGDQRISKDGFLVIKAQEFRSQEKNRAEALRRLQVLLDGMAHIPKTRRPTRPGRSAVARRLESKSRHGQLKAARRRLED